MMIKFQSAALVRQNQLTLFYNIYKLFSSGFANILLI